MGPNYYRRRLARYDRLERDQKQRAREVTTVVDHDKYVLDPVGYMRDILQVSPTPIQCHIAELLLKPPYKVIVKAAHSVGKTFLAAALVNWFYDTRPKSISTTTAPTLRDVVDLLWTEVRIQRQRAGLPLSFTGPRGPEMLTSDEHWAKGYTASKGESFQGRHRPHMFFAFDEAEGIDPSYFTTTKTMFDPSGLHAWLVILNPTTTTSQAALEEKATGADGNPAWHIVSMSALDHPNVTGDGPIIPGAVSIAQLREWVADWCEPVGDLDEPEARDFEFQGKRWRPNSIGEARILGRRPSQGIDGVWSEALFDKACQPLGAIPQDIIPQIGCDVARKGDDWTALHGRCGHSSLKHETGNGWLADKTIGRLKIMAQELAQWHNNRTDPNAHKIRPEDIPIYIDEGNLGGTIVDMHGGYKFIGINAASKARREDLYPKKRSELWFTAAELAKKGLLSFSKLPAEVKKRIALQALAVTWEPDPSGRRKVEDKDDTKEKIGRSPDDMDAVNLAYVDPPTLSAPSAIRSEPRPTHAEDQPQPKDRPSAMFGRR